LDEQYHRRVTLDISVILPCFRAAPLARESVARLATYLEAEQLTWEVIVVDDGGRDFRDDEWADDPNVHLIRLPMNRGKGAAVRAGMLVARGAVRVFTDVDLPYDLELLPDIVRYICSGGFHLVIGDRQLPGSSYRLDIAWTRRVASALFTTFVGTLVTRGLYDTQCGIKGVRGDVAAMLFPMLRVDRFAFDVELMVIALRNGLRVKRIPVQLRHNQTSSVRLLRDSIRGVMDLVRIKVAGARGDHDSPQLQALGAQR
jgi:dolichyl-phosphate beta-glucosyltransferase